ncbi:hypothetical protein ACH5RR_034195 [Cinchona calisaya]|uniref:Uncharacterized protein n=1 Tax=Cinchona calisaya TaxID=153742 RepID=A0ABD2YE15_9GENT
MKDQELADLSDSECLQQVLAQAQAQGSLRSFNANDGQPPRNDGSIYSPGQSNSPKVKMTQMQQSSSQQQDQLKQQQQQQQLQQVSKSFMHGSDGAVENALSPN